MHTNTVKKAFGLLFAYAIIIVGIFIMQFRSDSVISEKIGALRVTLAELRAEDGTTSLRNRMNVAFNGISFIVDDERNAAMLRSGEQAWRSVQLISWSRDALSCEFIFSGNIALQFSLSDDTDTARLLLHAQLPDGVSDFRIPYTLTSGASIVTHTNTYLQLDLRSSQWELTAAGIDGNVIAFTNRMNNATYSYYDATKKFTFESVSRFAAADSAAYNSTISAFKQNLISAFTAQSTAAITEQEAVSFVAAMSERGRYNEALDAVPSSFRRGMQRTYLSSPYFDSLAAMLPSLQQQLVSFNDIVMQNTLDAFAVPRIDDYMCMHPGSASVRRLLATGAALDEQACTVMQATHVLRVYDSLLEKNGTLASLLEAAVPVCLNVIAAACNVENELVTISESGTFLSVIQAAEVGDALLRYGRASGNTVIERGGYVIINSYLAESASFDLRTLAELYPIIVHDNPYYPHFALLGFDNNEAVWSWTCATNMTFNKDSMGTVNITIDFPQSYTHYVIINGIQRFRTIYIYNIAFRTDPRFETYNSSGYVFRADTNTLLLKSRHREQVETVRFVYSDAAREAAERRTVTETDAAGNVIAPPPEAPAPQPELPDIPMSEE
ncbi:MAG: hypothetical protein IJR50_08235 [Treponema sp.]|nr:hypothetical protein [Treponema sp.]